MQNIKFPFIKAFLASLFLFLTFSVYAGANSQEKIVQAHANQVFHSQQSPTEGNAKGEVNIVDFFDYQCSHCSELSQTLNGLVKKDPNVHIIFKELPILGEESEFATKVALAAAKQNKYLVLHNHLMALGSSLSNAKVLESAKQAGLNMAQLKQDMNSKAVEKEIKSNLALSQKLGINGTPTLIIAKNMENLKGQKIYIIPGALSEGEITDILRKVRKS